MSTIRPTKYRRLRSGQVVRVEPKVKRPFGPARRKLFAGAWVHKIPTLKRLEPTPSSKEGVEG